MIRMVCDSCTKTIEWTEVEWFGVDHSAAPTEDADGERIEPDQLGAEHEFHLCSVDCLVQWAFARAYSPEPAP